MLQLQLSFITLKSYRTFQVSYTYTIYKGSTTSSPILDTRTITVNAGNYGSTVEQENILNINDRLEDQSSTFLFTINSFSDPLSVLTVDNVTNGTISSNSNPNYRILPGAIPQDIKINIYISPN